MPNFINAVRRGLGPITPKNMLSPRVVFRRLRVPAGFFVLGYALKTYPYDHMLLVIIVVAWGAEIVCRPPEA